MKKIAALLCALVLLGLFALPSMAACPTHHMTHGTGGQDALIVGEVLEATDEYLLIDVVRTVNGRYARSPFRLNIDADDPILERTSFQAGDGILASVNFTRGNRAGQRWHGMYRVELMQDTKIRMDVNDLDAGFVEWYVNTGQRNLFGNQSRVYRRGSRDPEMIFDGETWHMNSLDPSFRAPSVFPPHFVIAMLPVVLLLVFLSLVAFTVAMLVRRLRKRRA